MLLYVYWSKIYDIVETFSLITRNDTEFFLWVLLFYRRYFSFLWHSVSVIFLRRIMTFSSLFYGGHYSALHSNLCTLLRCNLGTPSIVFIGIYVPSCCPTKYNLLNSCFVSVNLNECNELSFPMNSLYGVKELLLHNLQITVQIK